MTIKRVKVFAAAAAGTAIIAAGAIVTSSGADSNQVTVAGGSGDSATGTTYVQPSVTAMKLPSTTTETPVDVNDEAPTALATALASPTYKATPAPGCVNNGQCP